MCTKYEEQHDIDISTDHRHMLRKKKKERIYEEFDGRPIHVLHTCLGDFLREERDFSRVDENIFVCTTCVNHVCTYEDQ